MGLTEIFTFIMLMPPCSKDAVSSSTLGSVCVEFPNSLQDHVDFCWMFSFPPVSQIYSGRLLTVIINYPLVHVKCKRTKEDLMGISNSE